MRESRMYGSVWGACSNGRPYRDPIAAVGFVAGKSVRCSERGNPFAKGALLPLQPFGFALPGSKLDQKVSCER